MPSGLGITRQEVEREFSRAGFNFEGRLLRDGQWLTEGERAGVGFFEFGISLTGERSMTGEPEVLSEATINFHFSDGVLTDEERALYIVMFFTLFFPSDDFSKVSDWALDSLKELNGSGESTRAFLDNRLRVADLRDSGFGVFISATPSSTGPAPRREVGRTFEPTPTDTASVKPLHINGTGDDVLTCTLGKGRKIFSINHRGSRNFVVWLHDDIGNSELLVNEIGRYSGSSTVGIGFGIFDIAPGPCTIEIKADGPWEVEIIDR